jgi:hypothetical protein|tara:strand:- start:2591 stop:2803 length:213 start_codon:yes stop_codon:yes gene_type:complete
MSEINPAITDLRDRQASEVKKTIRAESMRMALAFLPKDGDASVEEALNYAKRIYDYVEYGSVPPLPKNKK